MDWALEENSLLDSWRNFGLGNFQLGLVGIRSFLKGNTRKLNFLPGYKGGERRIFSLRVLPKFPFSRVKFQT